jgi:hypothetical protein
MVRRVVGRLAKYFFTSLLSARWTVAPGDTLTASLVPAFSVSLSALRLQLD